MNPYGNSAGAIRAISRLAATAFVIAAVFSWAGNWCDAAIIRSNAPSGGRQIVCRNIDPEFLGGARVEELTVAEPCREYFIGLTNLASGSLLSNAKAGGWRYTLMHGTSAIGTAVLNAEQKTGRVLGFNSLQRPGFAQETVEALQKAERLPQVEKQDYEIRFLNIPAVSFVAIWLHRGSDNILIPIPPTFGRMNAYQPYAEAEIIRLLTPHSENTTKSRNSE